jgi:hypothetical protein
VFPPAEGPFKIAASGCGASKAMTYAEFWAVYLRAHARPGTRILHYLGSLLALAALAIAIIRLDWRWALAAPLIGYGFAWTAHVALEGNRPQTFGHPFWSLISDFRMLGLWLTGRLQAHLAALAPRDGA